MSRRRPPPGSTLLGAGLQWQWNALVKRIKARDRDTCQRCGQVDGSRLEVHHIVARLNGGTDDPSNLILWCATCHRRHHAGGGVVTDTKPPKRPSIFTPRPKVW